MIASRCKIGKGFTIHQGCTVGHQKALKKGPKIGNDVVLYANSLILGEIKIGNNVTVCANSLVINDIKAGLVVFGNPAKQVIGI